MISPSLIFVSTGYNWLSKSQRPLLTSSIQSDLSFGELWMKVNQSWSQLFEKGPKNQTELNLKALIDSVLFCS